MAVQVYLVHLQDDHQHDEARSAVADLTNQVGGFVLMATSAGSIIAAFDERWVPAFKQHRAVAFCGAVNVNPQGAAAAKLQEMFAANVAAQLASREPAPAAGVARYRPLRWHIPADPCGADAAG